MTFKKTSNPNGIFFAPIGTILENRFGNVTVTFPDGTVKCNFTTFNDGIRSFIFYPQYSDKSFFGTWIKTSDITSNYGWNFSTL